MFYRVETKMRKIGAIFLVGLMLLCCGGGAPPPVAAEAVRVDHKVSRKALTRKKYAVDRQRFEEKIRGLKKDEQRLRQSRAAVLRELDDIDRQIHQQQLRVSLTSREVDQLTEKIEEGEQNRRRVLLAIEENRSYVNERLMALHRMKKTGSWHLFSTPDSLFEFWKRRRAMKDIIRSDVALLSRQTVHLKALDRANRFLEGERSEKKLLDGRLAQEMQQLETEKKRRQTLLSGVAEKRELILAAVAAAEKALEKTMALLESPEPMESAKPVEKTPGKKEKPALRTSSSKTKKTVDFASRQGALPMPVTGRIVSKFGTKIGEDDKSFTFQSGIDIKVERGEPVRSVFPGKIVYADWLRGYGTVVIINHGDHYYTLYAHVEELFKKKGDRVDDREVIATAGDAGPVKGPYLHFEVRHYGKSVDPLQWLKKRSTK